jgi:hypothetical protein
VSGFPLGDAFFLFFSVLFYPLELATPSRFMQAITAHPVLLSAFLSPFYHSHLFKALLPHSPFLFLLPFSTRPFSFLPSLAQPVSWTERGGCAACPVHFASSVLLFFFGGRHPGWYGACSPGCVVQIVDSRGRMAGYLPLRASGRERVARSMGCSALLDSTV